MSALLVLGFVRPRAIFLRAVSFLGFALTRRPGALKWVLAVLPLEGAVRIGTLISLPGVAWRRLTRISSTPVSPLPHAYQCCNRRVAALSVGASCDARKNACARAITRAYCE